MSVSVDTKIVPVDPGQSGGQVRCVPVDTAGGSQLTSQRLLNVHDRLQVTQKNLAEKRNVGNGQSKSINFAQSLLIRKCWNVSPKFFKSRVDAGATKKSNVKGCSKIKAKVMTYLPGLLCS